VNGEAEQLALPGFEEAERAWRDAYRRHLPEERARRNRSGIEIEPLYTPRQRAARSYLETLGFPGAPPFTRGIYPTMHRGRPWSQRQLVGLGTPADYNARLRQVIAAGASAISLIPCNSVYRGLDVDQVDPLLLGTCGTTVNSVADLETCLEGIPIERLSIGLNDPLPFPMLAFLLVLARRRGVPWSALTGTSNQSDYLSHFVANHMFLRLALPGSRRVLLDAIAFCREHLPGWNPVSVVGQHMQQAGATPAEAMALTLCTAIQYAEDCLARGLAADQFLPRFTFFFDISISFFEEIAKLRAGRRLWARIARERLGARDPRSWRFKVHTQTSGVDLTREQPLNNIARVAVQALAAILGGTQSLHTDGYDEALTTPTERAARIAVATQNILREEAGLAEVIDPLGGSYYLETLTDRMEERIAAVIERIDAAGGMYRACQEGLVQGMIGASALAFQERVERGEQVIVGVNAYRDEAAEEEPPELERPDPAAIAAQIERHRAYKAGRDGAALGAALDRLAAVASGTGNCFAAVVEAAEAGATLGEICACLRRELGDGQPLVVA